MLANVMLEAMSLGKMGYHTASLTPSEISALSEVHEPVSLLNSFMKQAH